MPDSGSLWEELLSRNLTRTREFLWPGRALLARLGRLIFESTQCDRQRDELVADELRPVQLTASSGRGLLSKLRLEDADGRPSVGRNG
jgi:hypothetical protein